MSFVFEIVFEHYGLEASCIWPKPILRDNKLEQWIDLTVFHEMSVERFLPVPIQNESLATPTF